MPLLSYFASLLSQYHAIKQINEFDMQLARYLPI